MGEWWSELDTSVRNVALILLCVGVALIAVGVTADVTGAWQAYPFLVNLVSSAASACFGIPLALAVLRHWLNQQEDRSQALKVKRLAVATANQLCDAVSMYWQERQRLEVAERELIRAERLLGASLSWMPVGELRFDDTTMEDSVSVYEGSLKQLRAILAAVSSAYAVGALGTSRTDSIAEEVRTTWRYLDEFIRPQLLASGANWISGTALMYSRTNPWHPFPTRDAHSEEPWTIYELLHDLHGNPPWDDKRRSRHGTVLALARDDVRMKLQSIKDLRELSDFASTLMTVLQNNPPR